MMPISDAIEQTETAVRAALDEVSMAVMFHETWKPTAYDGELHARMGNSHATHAFQIIRASLRREMLLSLMRVWDTYKHKQTLRMSKIVDNLRDKTFFAALSRKRAKEFRDFPEGIQLAVLVRLETTRDEVVALGRKYQEGGSGFEAFEKLQGLRNERLAHRQLAPTTASAAEATDQDIEVFYADSLDIVKRLVALVLATACDLEGTGDVYRHHAQLFWANARGERTEGHPNYRQPSPL